MSSMRYFSVIKFVVLLVLFIPVLTGYSIRPINSAEHNLHPDSLIEQARKLVTVATNHDSVSVLLTKADQLAKISNNLHQSNDVLILKGLNEYYIGNYEQAVDYYFQALSLIEQSNDSILLARVFHNLGMIYDEFEDYDLAIDYFLKSLKISELIKDDKLRAKTYQNIAISYQNKKELATALEYNQRANQLAMDLNDTQMLIDVTNNFGTIAYDQNKLDESLEYYQKALKLYLEINDNQGVALAYNNIGLVYLDKKNYETALTYFMKSLHLANELKMNDFIGDLYGNLTIYYEELNDYKQAYMYYDKYNTVYDSLIGEKKSKMIRQIQAKYQLLSKTKELEELKLKNQTQMRTIDAAKSIQVYLFGITLLALILVVATIYLLRKEKKLASELKLKTTELHNLNASKDKFFSIIAHDLKNPFNALISYTSILKSDLDLFPKDELKQIISDLNQASENGFSLLQNLLVWSRSQTNRIQIYKTNFFLMDVVEQLKALIELNLLTKQQLLKVEVDPELVVFADKDMISTVLRNLVFNALKFSEKGSEVVIKSRKKGRTVQVDVIDNGIGMTAEVIDSLFLIDKNLTTPGTDGEAGTGLGLLISNEFISKNDGLIWVESTPGKGSVFSFTIPLGTAAKV